jgi:hypothetical protein
LELGTKKKWVSPLCRTAQPSTLASFRTWGSSTGAGRIRLTRGKSSENFQKQNNKFQIPNSKSQTNSKFKIQYQNSLEFLVSILAFVWCLVLGIWIFDPSAFFMVFFLALHIP